MDLEELKELIKEQQKLNIMPNGKLKTLLLADELVLELIERCEKAEANAIVTDNTKTLAAALERNAELEAKLSEMEKQEPIYQFMVNRSLWLDCLKETYEKTDEDCRRIVYALPVPQQQDNRINSNHNEILKDALKKIIQMNIQYAHDRYGNANEAENMGCVKVAREALCKLPPITK